MNAGPIHTAEVSAESSLKRLAWAFGCAKKGSAQERELEVLLLSKATGGSFAQQVRIAEHALDEAGQLREKVLLLEAELKATRALVAAAQAEVGERDVEIGNLKAQLARAEKGVPPDDHIAEITAVVRGANAELDAKDARAAELQAEIQRKDEALRGFGQEFHVAKNHFETNGFMECPRPECIERRAALSPSTKAVCTNCGCDDPHEAVREGKRVCGRGPHFYSCLASGGFSASPGGTYPGVCTHVGGHQSWCSPSTKAAPPPETEVLRAALAEAMALWDHGYQCDVVQRRGACDCWHRERWARLSALAVGLSATPPSPAEPGTRTPVVATAHRSAGAEKYAPLDLSNVHGEFEKAEALEAWEADRVAHERAAIRDAALEEAANIARAHRCSDLGDTGSDVAERIRTLKSKPAPSEPRPEVTPEPTPRCVKCGFTEAQHAKPPAGVVLEDGPCARFRPAAPSPSSEKGGAT